MNRACGRVPCACGYVGVRACVCVRIRVRAMRASIVTMKIKKTENYTCKIMLEWMCVDALRASADVMHADVDALRADASGDALRRKRRHRLKIA